MKRILLHGLGQTSSSWADTINSLKNQSDIICPDLSDLLSGKEVSYKNLYGAFSEYCMKFSEPLDICGLSLGGILALQYGIENPDKVNSLALIGAQFAMPKGMLKFQNIIFRFMPESMFRPMGFGKNDFINLSKSMMDLNFKQDLKKITCPVLVVCGEKDKANKQASLQLKELIPQSEIVLIENSGHEVNKDNPLKLATVLNTFYK